MLDHVSITVGDLDRAARFYDAVMAALGYPCVYRHQEAIGYGACAAGPRTIRGPI